MNPRCIGETQQYENQENTLNETDIKVNLSGNELRAQMAASQLPLQLPQHLRPLCLYAAITISTQQPSSASRAEAYGRPEAPTAKHGNTYNISE